MDLDRRKSRQIKSPVRFSSRGLKSKICKHIKSCPIYLLGLERNLKLQCSLRIGTYEDWQIHTKTGSRPIKLQESWSGPHTNRTPSNNKTYHVKVEDTVSKYSTDKFNEICTERHLL